MEEYHKIQSVYKRNEKTHKFLEGEFSLLEFDYLKNNQWIWTEKVDGTNVRIDWFAPYGELKFGGRTDNAQMPIFLIEKIQTIFTKEKFILLYPDISMTLYCEGYGAKVQKGGGNYNPNGVDVVLFDIKIDKWWLERSDVEDIAQKLGLRVVPVLNKGTLLEAVEYTKKGFNSQWGNFLAEGLVLRPGVELKNRNDSRIITKVKHKDF